MDIKIVVLEVKRQTRRSLSNDLFFIEKRNEKWEVMDIKIVVLEVKRQTRRRAVATLPVSRRCFGVDRGVGVGRLVVVGFLFFLTPSLASARTGTPA